MLESIQTQPPNSPETSPSFAEYQRQQFGLSLVERGLVTPEFYESGVLDAFEIDEATRADALTHMLIGDEFGGGHHLPTIVDLGVEGRTVASRIVDPSNPAKPLSALRKAQRLKETGVFRALDVRLETTSGEVMEKDGGSMMFPNEWDTQHVLEAVLATVQTQGEHDQSRGSYVHTAEIDGVAIRAITDDQTGKIITAFPK